MKSIDYMKCVKNVKVYKWRISISKSLIMLNIWSRAQQSVECNRLVKTLTRFNSFSETMQWSDEDVELYHFVRCSKFFLRSHPIL